MQSTGRLPRFSLLLWKMEHLKFKNLTLHIFYEWFGLRFTGAGLPSLARRARVPADCKDEMSMPRIHFTLISLHAQQGAKHCSMIYLDRCTK